MDADVIMCSGTGTIVFGARERGARAFGFDQSHKFALGTRSSAAS
jgi:hypothetical protein